MFEGCHSIKILEHRIICATNGSHIFICEHINLLRSIHKHNRTPQLYHGNLIHAYSIIHLALMLLMADFANSLIIGYLSGAIQKKKHTTGFDGLQRSCVLCSFAKVFTALEGFNVIATISRRGWMYRIVIIADELTSG